MFCLKRILTHGCSALLQIRHLQQFCAFSRSLVRYNPVLPIPPSPFVIHVTCGQASLHELESFVHVEVGHSFDPLCGSDCASGEP